jgi:ribosomal protein S18 acetylase RimI-like enzyme
MVLADTTTAVASAASADFAPADPSPVATGVPNPPAPNLSTEDLAALNNPAWSSLTGYHARIAIGNDLVKHFPDDVATFTGIRTFEDPGVWDAIVEVFGPDAEVGVSHAAPILPEGWVYTRQHPGVQLVQTDALQARPDAEAVELGATDSADMLDLVARTQPGPFKTRTHEMGRYVGIRRDGRLIALAGERLHPDGWTEISAVCVDPEYRRQGLATRLVSDVAFHIQQRGDKALLHASAANVNAIAAYQKLGFHLRRTVTFGAVRTPAA